MGSRTSTAVVAINAPPPPGLWFNTDLHYCITDVSIDLLRLMKVRLDSIVGEKFADIFLTKINRAAHEDIYLSRYKKATSGEKRRIEGHLGDDKYTAAVNIIIDSQGEPHKVHVKLKRTTEGWTCILTLAFQTMGTIPVAFLGRGDLGIHFFTLP